MKKKLLTLLAFVFLFALVSCDFSKNSDEGLKADGYDCIVTFDANGGTIGNYDVRRIYCKEGSYIIAPGEQGLAEVVMYGSTFGGWYTNKECTGEAFDVKNTKITGSITLYAKWEKLYTINILYGPEGNTTSKKTPISTEDATTVVARPSQAPKLTGYTFFEYYEDEDYTKVYDWTKAPQYNEDRELNIYAKYLKGDYIFVKSYSDLASIKSNTSIYLMNDVDCGGQTIKLPMEYRGTIIGNGYKISNFNVDYGNQSGVTDDSFGLFKKLSGSKIENLTIENVTVTAAIGNNSIPQYYGGVVAGKIENSTLTNVTVLNVNVELTLENVDESKFMIDESRRYGKVESSTINVTITNCVLSFK